MDAFLTRPVEDAHYVPTLPRPLRMSTDRHELRRQLRQARRELSAPVRLAAAELLATRLLALPFADIAGPVAGYWAMDGEIALHRWQMQLPPGQTYCLPILHGDLLRFAPWRPGQPLTANRYGIPEPDIHPDDALPAEAMALVWHRWSASTAPGAGWAWEAAGMIAASPSATSTVHRRGWSASASPCSRCPRFQSRTGMWR
jgi:5-formyltetrahydrofolate cyclo-ligase